MSATSVMIFGTAGCGFKSAPGPPALGVSGALGAHVLVVRGVRLREDRAEREAEGRQAEGSAGDAAGRERAAREEHAAGDGLALVRAGHAALGRVLGLGLVGAL